MKKRSVSEMAEEVLRFGQSEHAQLERSASSDHPSGRALKAYRKLARRLARRASFQECRLRDALEVKRLLIARIQRLEDEIDRLDPDHHGSVE